MDTDSVLHGDLELSRKLEYAEAQANIGFVEERARVDSGRGACWVKIAGTYCMFDGAQSPATQTFGLGLWEPVTAESLVLIERFFLDRGAPVLHEVSPLADASALALLNDRGYRPLEFSTVLVRRIDPPSGVLETLCPVRVAQRQEMAHWSELSHRGWNHGPELAAFVADFGSVNLSRTDHVAFYAEVNGELAATASLKIVDQVAVLAGASTLLEARGRGAQQSLLAYRLRYAAERGCTLASMASLPGSSSQRNAERNGLQVAYTRLKWELPEGFKFDRDEANRG